MLQKLVRKTTKVDTDNSETMMKNEENYTQINVKDGDYDFVDPCPTEMEQVCH